jgi:hypothetical protein
VSAGVPQQVCSWASVISGLHYINAIGDKLLSLNRLFADDTSLGYSSQDEAQIKYVINHDLHELGYWLKRWLIKNSNMTSFKRFESKPVVKIIYIYTHCNL